MKKNKQEELELKIIINSYLYYQFGRPLITDNQFDMCVHNYMHMKKGETKYSYIFNTFDGSTSEYLWSLLTDEHRQEIKVMIKKDNLC